MPMRYERICDVSELSSEFQDWFGVTEDGQRGWKEQGADTVTPFNSGIHIDRIESANGDGNNSNSVAQITIPNVTHIEIGTIGLNNPNHYNTTMLCSIIAGDENIYRTTVPAQNVVRETPATIKIYLSGWQTYAEDIAIY